MYEEFVFIPPDKKSQCTYSNSNSNKKDPHFHYRTPRNDKILPNILDHVGNTPLVKLNHLPKLYSLKCNVLVKCEFFNPGGSIKDRIALRMIEDAEKKGLLHPGDTIIEPTSGNTGIGLAVAAAVKGYHCIIVMPEKMSTEKANLLHALNAEIIRTPTAARYDAPDSHITIAQKLVKKIPRSIILDQYTNASNPIVHYDTTAEEILEQTDNKVDMIIISAGTGGSVTGIGRKIKEKLPECKIIGVDPYGSILAQPEHLNETKVAFYEVEGIGYDFLPTVLDRGVVDEWIKTNDKDSFIMARELIAREGLLCGGSSGSAMYAAIKAAKDLKENQTCVVILPDSVRNYMSKFIDDKWMAERGFLTNSLIKTQETKPIYWNLTLDKLSFTSKLFTIKESTKISEAITIMRDIGIDQIPVLSENEDLKGMVTVVDTMKKLFGGTNASDDMVKDVMITVFPTINYDQCLGELVTLLKMQAYVVVVDKTIHKTRLVRIVTHVDILNYLIEVN